MTKDDDGSGAKLRRPTRVVPAAVEAGGALLRLVGSTDANGRGTEFPITEVGPYVLVGDAQGLLGAGQPPFGLHPHAGLVAVSHAPGGGPWESRANVPGDELVPFGAGDVLRTVAGRGVVHDEPTVGEGDHELLQIILRLPARARDVPAGILRWRALEQSKGVFRLFDRESLADVGLDAEAHLVRVPAGERVELTLQPTHGAGFVYARRGRVTVAGVALGTHDVAELAAAGERLVLAADGEQDAECLVATAAALEEPWAKLLGHNGFVVAADREAAAAKLAAYERQRAHFGQR